MVEVEVARPWEEDAAAAAPPEAGVVEAAAPGDCEGRRSLCMRPSRRLALIAPDPHDRLREWPGPLVLRGVACWLDAPPPGRCRCGEVCTDAGGVFALNPASLSAPAAATASSSGGGGQQGESGLDTASPRGEMDVESRHATSHAAVK